MNSNYPDSLALLKDVRKNDLYKALLLQLKKDFNSANIELQVEKTTSPGELLQKLYESVYNMLCNNFNDYLNLLYFVDVSEQQVKGLQTNDSLEIAKFVTFIILKREWQKVWFRNKYS